MKLLRSPWLRLDKNKWFGNTSPFHLECQWKTSLLPQIVLHSATSNGFLGCYDFDMTMGPQRKVRHSATPGAWIFVFLFMLWTVCMLCLSLSLLFHLHSATFHPLNSLCNSEIERFLYLAPFPRGICLTQIAVLGCKAKRHFYYCQLQPPEKCNIQQWTMYCEQMKQTPHHHQLI